MKDTEIDFTGNPMALLFLSFWIMWTFYFIFNVVLFFLNRKSFYIKSRAPWLILSSAGGQYLMITSQAWKIIITPEKFPNMIDHWFLWFMVPLHFLPYPIRAFRFFLQFKMAGAKDDDVNPETVKFKESPFLWLRFHYKWVSDKAFLIYNWIIMAAFFIFGLVRNIALKENWPDKRGGGTTNFSYIVILCMLVVVSIFLWWTIYVLRKLHDELMVNAELIAIGIFWIVFIVPFDVIGMVSLKYDSVSRSISPIFGCLVCVASFLISFGMPVHLAIVKPDGKKSLGVKALDQIDSLLENEEASQLFYEFLEKRVCTENYDFIRAVQRYQTITNPNEMAREYAIIVNKYIKSDAHDHINIPAGVVKKIIESKDPPSATSFQEAYNEIRKVLNTDCLPGFKETEPAKQLARRIAAANLSIDD